MRVRTTSRRTGSAELDVCSSLVLATVGVVERDGQRPGIGCAKREDECRVLAHALGRVEDCHGLAQVSRDDTVDVEILLVDDLPLLSRSIRSMGWITRLRTRTTSPGLIEEGRRTRTLPMSDTSASAAADGHLDLALHRE